MHQKKETLSFLSPFVPVFRVTGGPGFTQNVVDVFARAICKIDGPATIDQWLAFQKPLGSLATAWGMAGPASAAYCANMSLSLVNHVFIAAQFHACMIRLSRVRVQTERKAGIKSRSLAIAFAPDLEMSNWPLFGNR